MNNFKILNKNPLVLSSYYTFYFLLYIFNIFWFSINFKLFLAFFFLILNSNPIENYIFIQIDIFVFIIFIPIL